MHEKEAQDEGLRSPNLGDKIGRGGPLLRRTPSCSQQKIRASNKHLFIALASVYFCTGIGEHVPTK